MQESKPERITTDYRDTSIEPGKIVAYNLSGYVRLGKITKLVRSDWKASSTGWWYPVFDLEVECLDQKQTSHIKNPGSFVILENLP